MSLWICNDMQLRFNRRSISLLIALLFSGCAEKPDYTHYSLVLGDYYYKPMTTYLEKRQDFDGCVNLAVKSIKSKRMEYFKPLQIAPISCSSSSGNVFCTGGGSTGGYETSWDDNQGQREDFVEMCLAEKGYVKSKFSGYKCSYEYRDKADLKGSPVIKPSQEVCARKILVHYDKNQFNEGFAFIHTFSAEYLSRP